MRVKRRCYHTSSTIPDTVRPEVVQAWNRLWNRLRRWPKADRAIEFRIGTPFKVGETEFRIRWHNPSSTWDVYLPTSDGLFIKTIPGSCAWGYSKPYTYLDDLQDAIDDLICSQVMRS